MPSWNSAFSKKIFVTVLLLLFTACMGILFYNTFAMAVYYEIGRASCRERV